MEPTAAPTPDTTTEYDGTTTVELPEHTKEFTAGGHRYTVRHTVPLHRFLLLEQFGTEYTLTGGVQSIFNQLVAQRGELNKMDFVGAAVVNNNLLNGIAKIDEKLNYAFMVCSLFIVRDGEDLREWSEQLARDKVADWNAAGIEPGFFLVFAGRQVPGFVAAWHGVSQMNLPPSQPSPATPS